MIGGYGRTQPIKIPEPGHERRLPPWQSSWTSSAPAWTGRVASRKLSSTCLDRTAAWPNTKGKPLRHAHVTAPPRRHCVTTAIWHDRHRSDPISLHLLNAKRIGDTCYELIGVLNGTVEEINSSLTVKLFLQKIKGPLKTIFLHTFLSRFKL